MKRKLQKGLFGIVVMLLLVGGFSLGSNAGPGYACRVDIDCPAGLICVYIDGQGGICILLREDCKIGDEGCPEIVVTPDGNRTEVLLYASKRDGYI